ncbi:acetylglutamate kinase [Jeotgalibacillus soli]|nr:acetylglutamate kinase [Jeotgalibacillus soli]
MQATVRNGDTSPSVIVIKLGGSILEGLNEDFYRQLKKLQQEGYALAIVHGGGPAINRELKKRQVPTSTKDGIRITSKEAVSIVQSTLVGLVNPFLVHQLNSAGIKAIGLSGYDGGLLSCTYLNEEMYGSVGQINEVNTDLLHQFFSAGFVPVISCIGVTDNGEPLNINADTVAGKVAHALDAKSLLFVTDTPGIKLNEQPQELMTPEDVSQSIASGAIYGGMIPKVEAALSCLNDGIPSVQIVGHQLTGTNITHVEVFK